MTPLSYIHTLNVNHIILLAHGVIHLITACIEKHLRTALAAYIIGEQ